MTGSAAEVAAAIRARQSFILTSHARPDGDAIGSQLGAGLRARSARQDASRVVGHDPAPAPYRAFPGIDRIEIVDARDRRRPTRRSSSSAATSSRPEVAGLDRYFVINIDHHLGNAMYGAVNWFDESARRRAARWSPTSSTRSACPGRRRSPRICTLASPPTPAASATARSPRARSRSAGASPRPASIPRALSRQIFDSFCVGRVQAHGRAAQRDGARTTAAGSRALPRRRAPGARAARRWTTPRDS